MSSWSSIKTPNPSQSLTILSTSNLEYSIRRDYEISLSQLSSAKIGDEIWKQSKEMLEKILLDLQSLTKNEQINRLYYLTLKNLSYLKEKEKDYEGAMRDGLEALTYSKEKTNETLLLTRIAFLSIYSNELLTCEALLYSGFLSHVLGPVQLELQKRYQKAQLTQPPLPKSEIFPLHLPQIIVAKSSHSLWSEFSLLEQIVKKIALMTISEILTHTQSRNMLIKYLFSNPSEAVPLEYSQTDQAHSGTLCAEENSSSQTISTENDSKILRKSVRQVSKKSKDCELEFGVNQKIIDGPKDLVCDQLLSDLTILFDSIYPMILNDESPTEMSPVSVLSPLFCWDSLQQPVISPPNLNLFLLQPDSHWSRIIQSRESSSVLSSDSNNIDHVNNGSLQDVLVLLDREVWQELIELVSPIESFEESKSIGTSDGDSKLINCLELFSLILGSLSDAVSRVTQSSSHLPLFKYQVIIDAVSHCWYGIRLCYPTLDQFLILVSRMSFAESILLAECCFDLFISVNANGSTGNTTPDPTFLEDTLKQLILKWEQDGYYEILSNSSVFQSQSTLIMRCYWVTILYLHEDRNRNIITGSSFEKMKLLCQKLIVFLNGGMITLAHLGGNLSEPGGDLRKTRYLICSDTIERLFSTEATAIQTWLNEIISSTTLLGTLNWVEKITPVLVDIKRLSGDDESILTTGVYGLSHTYPVDVVQKWLQEIRNSPKDSLIDFQAFDKFLTPSMLTSLSERSELFPIFLMYCAVVQHDWELWWKLANSFCEKLIESLRSDLRSPRLQERDQNEGYVFFTSFVCCFLVLRTNSSSMTSLDSSEWLKFINSLCHLFLLIGSLKHTYLSISQSIPHSLHLLDQELGFAISESCQHFSPLSASNLSVVIFSMICRAEVDLSLILSPNSSSQTKSILADPWTSVNVLSTLLKNFRQYTVSEQSWFHFVLSSFSLYVINTLEKYSQLVRVLSSDTAIFLENGITCLTYGSTRQASLMKGVVWGIDVSGCSANQIVFVLFNVERLLIQSLTLELEIPRDHEYSWSIGLTMVEKVYCDFSCRGLFRLDNGDFSRELQNKFTTILYSHYLPNHFPPREHFFNFPVECFSTELISSFVIFLGQLAFDLFGFPLCQNYCPNKTQSLNLPIVLKTFPPLYLLTRYCHQYRGVSNSLCRSACYSLFASVSQLRYLASLNSIYQRREAALVECLTQTSMDLPFTDFFSLVEQSCPCFQEGYCDEILQLFFLDLIRFGVPESEFDISLFPSRTGPTLGNESEIQDANYTSHYFFEIQTDDIKSYAHLNIFFNALTIDPLDLEIWTKFHEKILEIIFRCLEDLAYRLYPLHNAPAELHECRFLNKSNLTHILFGTYTHTPGCIYADLIDRITLFHDDSIKARSLEREGIDSGLSSVEKMYCLEDPCRFSRFALPSYEMMDDRKSNTPVDLTDCHYLIPLLFAKLNALLRIAENISHIVHTIYSQNPGNSTKYFTLCESRAVLYSALLKVFPTNCDLYRKCLKVIRFNALTGLCLLENEKIPIFSEWTHSALSTKEIIQDETFRLSRSEMGGELNSAKHFLSYVCGKSLWKLTHRGDLALYYLNQSNLTLSKGINGNEKIDKRLKALTVYEIHKIRFFSVMQLLCSIHNNTCGETENSVGFTGLVQALNATYFEPGKLVDNSPGVELTNVPNNPHLSTNHIAICSRCGHPKLSNSQDISIVLKILMDLESPNIPFVIKHPSSVFTESLWDVVLDSLKGIISSRAWDSYDFQSVHFLSQIFYVFSLAQEMPEFSWVKNRLLPLIEFLPLEENQETEGTLQSPLIPELRRAFDEIFKLFERKKPQIVSMWSHENSPYRLDQILGRLCVFERTRDKYISDYWTLLFATSSFLKASDLLASILLCSNKSQCTASIYWIETYSILAYIALTRAHFFSHKQESDATSFPPLEIMKLYYVTLESVFTKTKRLFHLNLRVDCLNLLIEMYGVCNNSQSQPSSQINTALEWCAAQSWTGRRNRLSKSSGNPARISPLIASQSEFSQNEEFPFSAPSPCDVSLKLDSPTKKRPREEKTSSLIRFVPQPLDDTLSKKKRAVERVKNLLQYTTSLSLVPTPPTSSPPIEIVPPQVLPPPQQIPKLPTTLTPSPFPSTRPTSQISKIRSILASNLPPPVSLLKKRDSSHLSTSSAKISAPRPAPSPRISQPFPLDPGLAQIIPSSPVSTQHSGGEKKRRAILKLQEIFRQEKKDGVGQNTSEI